MPKLRPFDINPFGFYYIYSLKFLFLESFQNQLGRLFLDGRYNISDKFLL